MIIYIWNQWTRYDHAYVWKNKYISFAIKHITHDVTDDLMNEETLYQYFFIYLDFRTRDNIMLSSNLFTMTKLRYTCIQGYGYTKTEETLPNSIYQVNIALEWNALNKIKLSISYHKLGEKFLYFHDYDVASLTCYSRRTTSDESWNMQKKSRVDDPMVAFLVKENWVKCIANLHVLYAVTEHVYKSQAFRSLCRSLGYHRIEISHYLMNNNPQKNCVKLNSKNSLIKIGYAVSKKRFVLILHYLTFHHIYQWQLSKIFIYRKRRTTSSWKVSCNDHSCIVCVSSVRTFFRRSFFSQYANRNISRPITHMGFPIDIYYTHLLKRHREMIIHVQLNSIGSVVSENKLFATFFKRVLF